MFNGKLILVLLAILPTVFMKTDYCSSKLCPRYTKHIGCNNTDEFSSNCGKDARILNMTSELRNEILDTHNKYRNQVAAGLEGFEPAARMATLQWDDELAKLAELNVKTCVMQHDECHNTEKFPSSGQNLAINFWWYILKRDESTIAKQQITNWFNEYQKCNMISIKKFPSNSNGFGHFTAMVQDRSTHVGCAILKRKDGDFIEQLMACNYARNNMLYESVYISGPAASKCETGPNPKYKNLCSEKEIYDQASTNVLENETTEMPYVYETESFHITFPPTFWFPSFDNFWY